MAWRLTTVLKLHFVFIKHFIYITSVCVLTAARRLFDPPDQTDWALVISFFFFL